MPRLTLLSHARRIASHGPEATTLLKELDHLFRDQAGVGLLHALLLGDFRHHNPGRVVEESVLGVLGGITFTGYFVLLWPLSFVNLRVLRGWALDSMEPAAGPPGARS